MVSKQFGTISMFGVILRNSNGLGEKNGTSHNFVVL